MRLGTSGFGVIAVVSLLVTATPERIDTGKEDRGRDESSVTWPVRVVNVISRIVPTRSRFVKIEDDSPSSSLRSNTYSTIPPSSSRQPAVPPSNVRNTETATKLPRFLHRWSVSTRASRLARNSKRPITSYPSDYWYTGFTVETFENGKSRRNVRSNSSTGGLATSRNLDESFAAVPGASSSSSSMDGDAPLPRLSSVLRRYARHRSRERETTSRDGDIGYEVGSTVKKNEVTGESSVESAITTYDRLTTWLTSATNKSPTSEGSSSAMSIFRDPTEHHESQIIRNLPAYESADENVVKSALINGTIDPVFHSSLRTMSSTAKNSGVSHYPANYQVGEQSKVPPEMKNDHRADDRSNGDRDLKRLVADSRTDTLTDPSVSVTSSSEAGPNGLRQEGLVHDSENLKEHSSTVRTLNDVTLHGHETMPDFDIAEEIVRARRITDESFPDLPISEGGSAHEENVVNANGVDILIPLEGNHEAIGARSFHTTSEENEKQGNTPSGSASLASRLPKHLGLKDKLDDEDSPLADKIETSPLAVNQIISAKSGYPNAKNNTGQSINFVDGKSKKIFYEIKPSVITDTDRVDDPQFPTTTTRQSFDKFLLSSVPSVYGKFGPYFIDEEDRRNVTERIGSTVQLDCRIGFLGDRKVTWLHHYKDSFRLLTVKKESYSVDRRISLNFQYPDNWRLQIAYASMRDSGLYKCQVEIDPDKSLVKGYYVVITAPTLTITDDSGRPVSGERHLKAGSALKLRCEARDVMPGLNESVLWMRGDETLTDDVSENRTTEIVDEREITVVISTLLVERAAPSHAGNYSCVVPDKAKTTIAVHVLNGELPAAVQHGSGVSTAVLNIWLIHLTASYGFLR